MGLLPIHRALPRILVVEPELERRMAIVAALTNLYTVTSVATLFEAADVLHQTPPLAILLSLDWADSDAGRQFILLLRQRPNFHDVVIIAMQTRTTVATDNARRIAAMVAGADSCEIHPLNLALLPTKVRLFARTRGALGRYH